MDTCKKLTVLVLLLSLGTTFSGSVFGFNLGALRDTAVNNIEQVPQFLNRVINRHKQHSAERNQNAFQDNREIVDNERVSFPYANTNPVKYQDQQNWGLNNPTSYPDNRGNTDHDAYKSSFGPLPNKYSQRQEPDSNSAISFPDNLRGTDYNGYHNTFNPTLNKGLQGNTFAPTPSHFINKASPGNNLYNAGNPVTKGSRDSYFAGNDQSNPADVYLSEHMIGSDTDFTDYSTTTDYDMTTTDFPLNRIAAPPAVVASILG